MPEPLRPTNLSKEGDDRLVVQWNDGHRSTYTWKHLRENCPCASCRGDHGKPPDPFHILTAAELAPRPPLAPVAMTPIGHYAYKITWNDGHDSGIYTLENLRALCECPLCQRSEVRDQGSGVRNQESGVRNQGSGIRKLTPDS